MHKWICDLYDCHQLHICKCCRHRIHLTTILIVKQLQYQLNNNNNRLRSWFVSFLRRCSRTATAMIYKYSSIVDSPAAIAVEMLNRLHLFSYLQIFYAFYIIGFLFESNTRQIESLTKILQCISASLSVCFCPNGYSCNYRHEKYLLFYVPYIIIIEFIYNIV